MTTTVPPEVTDVPLAEFGPIESWEEGWGVVGDPAATEPQRKRVRRGVVVGLVVVIATVGLYMLFNGPVATEWYRARQRHLAADLLVGRPAIGRGQTLATLQIPKIGLNVFVVQGDSPQELRDGPGHRIGTPAPGKRGNSLVFGHREAWGGPFADLSKLHKNDAIFVQLRGQQDASTFLVGSVQRVPAGDRRALAPSNDFRLTLVTGTGSLSDDRVVVTAISGTPGKLLKLPADVRATTPSRVGVVSSLTAMTLFAFGLALMAFVWLRNRRYGTLGVFVVVVPLVVGGLLGVFLQLDTMLAPLR